MIAELQSNIDQTLMRVEAQKKIKQKLGSDAVKEQRKIVRECSPQSVTHHLMVKL